MDNSAFYDQFAIAQVGGVPGWAGLSGWAGLPGWAGLSEWAGLLGWAGLPRSREGTTHC